MNAMRAFALSLALAALLTVMAVPLLKMFELGPAGMLLPVALITLVAGLPYAIAEARRSDREQSPPNRRR